jgi:hypothetical protein
MLVTSGIQSASGCTPFSQPHTDHAAFSIGSQFGYHSLGAAGAEEPGHPPGFL